MSAATMTAQAAPEFTVMRKPFQLAELSRAAGRMIAESKQPAVTNVVRLRKPVISDQGSIIRGGVTLSSRFR